MMRRYVKRWVMTGVVGVCMAGGAWAAAPGGAGPREGLLRSDHLDRLGIGIDYEKSQRRISFAQGGEWDLDSRFLGGTISWDAFPWLRLYGTAGRVESRLAAPGYGSGKGHGAAGAHARLWHMDIQDPSFMAGRASIDTTIEWSRSKLDDGQINGRWTEIYAALTPSYEFFVETIEHTQRVPYSLRLHVGPAFSRLDGYVRAGGIRYDFDEADDTGLAWGAELFLSHNLSIGYNGQRFQRTTTRITARYRF